MPPVQLTSSPPTYGQKPFQRRLHASPCCCYRCCTLHPCVHTRTVMPKPSCHPPYVRAPIKGAFPRCALSAPPLHLNNRYITVVLLGSLSPAAIVGSFLIASPSLCAGCGALPWPTTASRVPGAPPLMLEHRCTIAAPMRSRFDAAPFLGPLLSSPSCHVGAP
jgi:hypothetical protein